MRTARHPPCPPVDAQRRGVFTRPEALAGGWTDAMLATAVRLGTLVRPCAGLYVPQREWRVDADPASAHRRLAAQGVLASLAVHGAVASHTAAAAMAGLPVWRVPARACVTVRPRYTGDARVAHLHRARLPRSHVLDGPLPRTLCARTVLDIARELGVEDAVVVGDAALRRGLTDLGRLAACAQFCAGWPGSRRMESVLGLLDARAESPLESVSRIRLGRLALPRPEPQVEILDLHGHLLGRLDFYFDRLGVAGEVDGNTKYAADPFGALLKERRRQARLEDVGIVFVRWGRGDLADMARLEARIRQASRRGLAVGDSRRAWLARPTSAPQITRYVAD